MIPTAKNGQRILLLGATGAVGSQVLRLALAHPAVVQVVAPTRRALPAHDRLLNPVLDFTAPLPAAAPWWAVSGVICALGTTIRDAGTQAAFAAVDRDLPLAVARLARAAGADCYVLNSSLGASPRGNFYLRTKAEAELGLTGLGFASVTCVRPSLIDATRTRLRPGERAGLWAAHLLQPLIPRRYRPVTAEAIARCLLNAALSAAPGQHVIESEHIAQA